MCYKKKFKKNKTFVLQNKNILFCLIWCHVYVRIRIKHIDRPSDLNLCLYTFVLEIGFFQNLKGYLFLIITSHTIDAWWVMASKWFSFPLSRVRHRKGSQVLLRQLDSTKKQLRDSFSSTKFSLFLFEFLFVLKRAIGFDMSRFSTFEAHNIGCLLFACFLSSSISILLETLEL